MAVVFRAGLRPGEQGQYSPRLQYQADEGGKIMTTRAIFTVFLVAVAGLIVSAQGTFTPRDADENEAWTIYQQYKDSKKIESMLESQIKQKFSDSIMAVGGQFGILGTDREALAQAQAMTVSVNAERKRQAELEAAWEKKFYWRYGDLRWMADRVRDAKTGREMDRIEFALTYFPFNYKKGSVPATITPSAVGGVAEKGNAESWSHIRVTVSPVTGFKTEDRPGWRNNGTDFRAAMTGPGPIVLKIDVTGKGGVSYYDYTANINVRTSAGRTIIAETRKISTNGGSVSFSASMVPAENDGSLNVNVSISGGNPEGFTYYVSGTVDLGSARGSSAASNASATVSEPKTLFSSGNDQGVANGGTPPSFSLGKTTLITQIVSYHWNNGRGAPGGTIALRDSNGKIFGPWSVSVRNKVYWEVNEQIKLPSGTYTVVDSDPSTWAQNSMSGGKGMVTIKGI